MVYDHPGSRPHGPSYHGGPIYKGTGLDNAGTDPIDAPVPAKHVEHQLSSMEDVASRLSSIEDRLRCFNIRYLGNIASDGAQCGKESEKEPSTIVYRTSKILTIVHNILHGIEQELNRLDEIA